MEFPQVRSIVDRVVPLSVAVRDHVPMVQTAQNAVEVPQDHYIDRIANASVVMQHQAPTAQTAQTQRKVPVIQKAQRTAEAPEIVDIPVPQIMLEQSAEVIQVIPQEPISERTVEQTLDVPLAQCIDMIVDVPVVKRRQSQYPH